MSSSSSAHHRIQCKATTTSRFEPDVIRKGPPSLAPRGHAGLVTRRKARDSACTFAHAHEGFSDGLRLSCVWVGIVVVAGLLLGCGRKPGDPTRLVLATTSTVRDSGLLDQLVAAFERETGIRVAAIAAGSGEALRIGRDGNADLLLVHDPLGEAALQAEGVVAEDVEVARGRYVVVGPQADPAAIAGLEDGAAVFRALGAGKAPFVSRGDGSGTHRLEQRLWEAVGIRPEGQPWYVSVGAGMMHTLRVANERQAYCLAELATWLRGKEHLDLRLLVDSEAPLWANVYSVLLLSPARFPSLNHEGARRFRDFVTRGTGRDILRRFGEEEFGRIVFTVPSAP